jgi:hypothetical protein
MHLKTLMERSGSKVIIAFVLAWLATKIPMWVQLLTLPAPWDQIVSEVAGLVSAVLRMLRLNQVEPSMSATEMPEHILAQLSPKEQCKVEALK